MAGLARRGRYRGSGELHDLVQRCIDFREPRIGQALHGMDSLTFWVAAKINCPDLTAIKVAMGQLGKTIPKIAVVAPTAGQLAAFSSRVILYQCASILLGESQP